MIHLFIVFFIEMIIYYMYHVPILNTTHPHCAHPTTMHDAFNLIHAFIQSAHLFVHNENSTTIPLKRTMISELPPPLPPPPH